MSDVRSHALAVVEGVAARLGLEVVEVEWTKSRGRNLLRIFIDRPGSRVGVDDCSTFSERIGPLLDREAGVPGPYDLEVSSPGIERPLVKPADFARFTGSMVRLRTKRPMGDRRNFAGKLIRADTEAITLVTESGEAVLRYEDIEKARLMLPPEQFDRLLKGGA